mgnify:CR=1 FL=1
MDTSVDSIKTRVIKIIAAQSRVAFAGKDFDNAGFHPDNRHIKRTSAKVIHDDVLWVLLASVVYQRRGRGFVDNPLNLQPGDLTGFLA